MQVCSNSLCFIGTGEITYSSEPCSSSEKLENRIDEKIKWDNVCYTPNSLACIRCLVNATYLLFSSLQTQYIHFGAIY